MRTRLRLLAACCALGVTMTAVADDRTEFNRRAAERDLAAFKALDVNGDNRLARAEAQPAVDFIARFADMDVDSDGIVTPEEMARYLAQTYGVSPSR